MRFLNSTNPGDLPMKRNILFVLFTLSLTLQAQAEELMCFAGIQPNKQKNEYISEKKTEDFTTSETSIIRYGKTYSVRKYQVKIENFIVEAVVYLDSGLAPELSITDRITGTIAEVREHGQVRLSMSGPRTTGLIHISAACTQR
ncbi:MAG: hypothetical protein AB7I27_14840 [Bacteriovoracaceae bacterium]